MLAFINLIRNQIAKEAVLMLLELQINSSNDVWYLKTILYLFSMYSQAS